MLRGLYGAASGMVAQQQRQEMLANNLANASTPGYKADQASLRTFPKMLLQAVNAQSMPVNRSYPIGELATGVYLQERIPNFRQGDLMESGNTTDVALLQGILPENEDGREMALFYTVEHDNEELRYTRNGNFTVDGEGFLTTAQGRYILSTDGERMAVGSENFTVAANGIVTNEAGVQVGQINVVLAEDPLQLVKEGDGLLRFTEDGELPSVVANEEIAYQIQQGFIERSNVDAGQTMTEMMATYRSFEANQRVLQAYDQSLEKAVNEVGRIG